MSKYFKLAPGQSILWDPTQPKTENQKLVGNQIKPLEKTPAVKEALINGRLETVEEKDYVAYCKAEGITPTTVEEEETEEVKASGKTSGKGKTDK